MYITEKTSTCVVSCVKSFVFRVRKIEGLQVNIDMVLKSLWINKDLGTLTNNWLTKSVVRQ